MEQSVQAHLRCPIPSIFEGRSSLCAPPQYRFVVKSPIAACASTAERFCYRKKLSRISVIMSFLEHNRIERDNYPALSKHLRIQRSSPSSICKSAYYSSSAAASSSADFSSAGFAASRAFILRLIFFSSPLKSTTLA